MATRRWGQTVENDLFDLTKKGFDRMPRKLRLEFPRRETAEAKAERLITEELTRLQWTGQDLVAHSKSDPRKLAIAARLRQETTLSIKEIAERLHLGKPKGAKANLHKRLSGRAASTDRRWGQTV